MQNNDQLRRPGHMASLASRSAPLGQHMRSEDSWVEISSQPSSSSLSSVGEEVVTTGLRVQNDPRGRGRRLRPLHLSLDSRQEGTSSQEEYDESESESDRVMTSSGEGVPHTYQPSEAPFSEDDKDENRTAINYPIHNGGFTPQPNAFSHPPSSAGVRNASQPIPGSYFPASRPAARQAGRQSFPLQTDSSRPSHLPQNILSPSYTAAAQHEEALRASLNTLLSCAAAARGLQTKRPQPSTLAPAVVARSHRIEPTSLRLVPGSALPTNTTTTTSPPPLSQQQNQTHFQEPTFTPTLRRASTSTSSTSVSTPHILKDKRKASSRERRSGGLNKKPRRSAPSADDLTISPTLLTWVVSAGVVVFLSALSFSAGYSVGREAGILEAEGWMGGDEQLRSCAQEAAREGLGLRRSLVARGAGVQV